MFSLPRLILFSLAVFGDIVRVLPKNKRQSWNFWVGNYRLEEKLFNKDSFTNTVSRLLKTERIEKEVRGGKVRIKVTPEGLKFLSVSLDLDKFRRGRWDGRWRMVVFDIAEKSRKQRDFLRSELKDLGFGMLQESVWISPFPLETELEELFSSRRISGEVLVSKAEVLVGDQKEIAERVWNLNKLNEAYVDLVSFWEELSREEKRKKEAYEFQKRYFELLWRDPFLPQEMLPGNWLGDAARRLYLSQVRKVLLS